MNTPTIIELINTAGFPIGAVVVCGWFIMHLVKVGEKDKDKLYDELAQNRIVNQGFLSTLQSLNCNINSVQSDIKEIKNIVERNDK